MQPTANPIDITGKTLDGRFRLERAIGQGGMGTVYEATQLSVGRKVAVKTIRADVISPLVEGRFMQEARVLADIRHANVIQLVEFGRDPELDVLYFAMEFVAGTSLASVMRQGALAPEFALEVARQICSGLAQAHAAGIIHRDLKPENVMLTVSAENTLQVKLLDFGIAQAIAAETRLTATGAITGTPHYMSPEQAQDFRITSASDLYSLGVILYEMLSGSLPFRADTPLALLFKHVQEPPVPLDDQTAGLPDGVSDLVMDLLEKSAQTRPSSATEAGRRIDELRRRLKMPTLEIEVVDGLPTFEAWKATHHSIHEFQHSSALVAQVERPKKLSWPNLIGLLLFIGATVGGLYLRNDTIPERAPEPPVEKIEAPEQGIVYMLAAKHIELAQRSAVEEMAVHLREESDAREDLAISATPKGPKPAGPSREVVTKTTKVESQPEAVPKGQKTRAVNAAGIVRTTVPPIDDATLAMRKFKAGGTCDGTQHCVFESSEAPGHVACLSKSTCKADCIIGNCKQYCLDEATCEFSCTGGGCQRMAIPTAKMTEKD